METRGTLRVYLGAAPGVGKTYAMLDEGHRRAQRGTDVVVGLIESHGPGVPDAVKESMFAPFQRLGDAPRGSGVGLGLAVARGFVEAIGGTLHAEDTPGGGLTMVFALGIK